MNTEVEFRDDKAFVGDREIIFWGDRDQDILHCTTFYDAVQEILDRYYHPGQPTQLPETVEVWGFARMDVTPDCVRCPIEDTLEWLYDDYGDPYGYMYEQVTDIEAVKKAARHFQEVVAENFWSWQCEDLVKLEINVMQFIKDGAPDYDYLLEQ